jgi:hypothetical protein
MSYSTQIVEFVKYNYTKIIGILACLTPILFGFNYDYIQNIFSFLQSVLVGELIAFLIFIFFLVIVAICVGYFLFFAFYYVKPLEMKKMSLHPMISRFDDKQFNSNKTSQIMGGFILSMILEELLFRFYILGSWLKITFFVNPLTLDYSIIPQNIIPIIITSMIFSIYHIHIYFSTQSKSITIVFIIASFFLGIILNIVFLFIGVLGSFLIHWISVYFIYKLIANHLSIAERKRK